ncbi:MAG: phosphoadenylyl-sulfate reductase [Acidobacteria bacterium]|nr:MAG: phosphoadenylyl-sulfate reductase [Acidobacteriota bacterium]PYS11571.1 MAG: phosphoadenylyl-sulfate reductase [Acidobacteriota bacterium]
MDLAGKTRELIENLRRIERTQSPTAFACSFGAEDMVVLDAIAKSARRIEVFTLDTGRLPEETHALLETVRNKYPIAIRTYFPDAIAVQTWVEQNGPNGFYRSVAQRQQCCHIRKVEPLKRALVGKKSWITGLRREQSAARQTLELEAWDEANGLLKINPLLDWTTEDVWAYIRTNDVPYNALHDRAYPSIGCAPCSRAVHPGEDSRAGRWWWESSSKECGLHLQP